MIKGSARCGFFLWNESKVSNLAKKEYDITLMGTFPEKMLYFIQFLLDMTMEDALKILEQRLERMCASWDDFEELVETEDCQEHVDRSDMHDYNKHLQSQSKCRDEIGDLSGYITELVKNFHKPGIVSPSKEVRTPLPGDDVAWTEELMLESFPHSPKKAHVRKTNAGNFRTWAKLVSDVRYRSVSTNMVATTVVAELRCFKSGLQLL